MFRPQLAKIVDLREGDLRSLRICVGREAKNEKVSLKTGDGWLRSFETGCLYGPGSIEVLAFRQKFRFQC